MPERRSRVVSLHDVDARPIGKGRLGKPVEFGYKAQIVDNDDGVILDHNVEVGNPPDAPQLAPAIARINARTGRTPTRGHRRPRLRRATVEARPARPRGPLRGDPTQGPTQRRAPRVRAPESLPRQVKWRTGSEGRINHIKRSYGWNRTELTGINGARTWCRTRRLRPQPRQDQRPRRMKRRLSDQTAASSPTTTHRHLGEIKGNKYFEVEVASCSATEAAMPRPVQDRCAAG